MVAGSGHGSAGADARRTLMISAGWTAAFTIFSYFGSRGADEVGDAAYRNLDALGWVLVIVTPLLLAGAWQYPRPVFAAGCVLTAVYLGRFYAGGPVYLTPIVLAAILGWREPLRRSCPPAVVAAVGFPLVALVRPTGQSSAVEILGLFLWGLVPLVPWALAALVRMNRTSSQQAAEARRRQVVDEERMRVAREVHDVVGHSLAVISMQAGVALHVAERRPEQSRIALDAIARSSRDALAELRRTLAVFVGDTPQDGAAARRPEAGVADVPGLVEQFSAGGRHVELEIAPLPELPPTIGLAVFRVVQESLTNAVRHGPGATTGVRIDLVDDAVHVEVTDDGPSVPAQDGTGTGLVGMRERCEALGGTFHAGPRDAGGWRVHAELPCTRTGDR